jgi:hypothetical protein
MGVFLIAAGACGHGGRAAADEETILRERVAAFWAAKARSDWETAETYIEPEKRPEVGGYFRWLKESPPYGTFESIQVKALDIKRDQAQVVVEYAIKWRNPALAGAPIMERESKETWRKTSGQWFLVMERPSPADMLRKLGPREN